MMNKQEMFEFAEAHAAEQLALLKTLAAIPAPSHREERRVEFICNWLLQQGTNDVRVDDALNVILRFPHEDDGPYTVFTAHTDVVFPDTTPLPVREENGILYAPGVGDDTANLVTLMLIAKYLIENDYKPMVPTLFVFNSCEEGLGNLKGIRQICKDWRVREHITFDGCFDSVVCRAVGSERWKVRVKTVGGHSYASFGNPNAIAALSEMITRLYRQPVPVAADRKTTYNVGGISGGTSVNTIAQNAEMLYEYRSDDLACMEQMRRQFFDVFNDMNCGDTVFEKELIGERPCSAVSDTAALEKLLDRCSRANFAVTGVETVRRPSSTDANIPLSMGIPATSIGLYRGAQAHTREEWLEISSLVPGLKVGMLIVLASCF